MPDLADAHFLDGLVNRMPFAIAALQVDGEANAPPNSKALSAARTASVCPAAGVPETEWASRAPYRTHREEFYRAILTAGISDTARIPQALAISIFQGRVSLII